ncbi:MAG: nucleoside recognition protein [Desulfotomaculum sp.]|nr:nucleoside recognition protein [Desulfotomaculum sp.]
MDYAAFLKDAISGSLDQVLLMAAIIFPLMLVLEIARDLNVLDKLSIILRPLMRLFKVSDKGTIPLMAGLVFGISYGAGVIIDSAKSGELNFRDLYLINIFLVVCHSLFEDTALFVVLGADFTFLVVSRFILAVIVTLVFSWWKKFTIQETVLNSTGRTDSRHV